MPPKLFTHGPAWKAEVWVRFRPGITNEPWRLAWETTAPGVIQYNWKKPDAKDSTDASINQAIEAGRWVDLTAAEMQQYAEQLDKFADLWVGRANLIRRVQTVTEFLVVAVGSAAMIYISPGLAPGKPVQPGASPKAGSSLPPSQPRPAPAPQAPIVPPSRPPTMLPPRPDLQHLRPGARI